jgi:hypothetical protein
VVVRATITLQTSATRQYADSKGEVVGDSALRGCD